VQDLFDAAGETQAPERLGEGALWMPGFAVDHAAALIDAVQAVIAQSPWRQMLVPGGHRMSVAMSNAGALGWISDAQGYRYSPIDPLSAEPWPALPGMLAALGREAARAAGYADFDADACLINRYRPGSRLSLHQDRNERDRRQPVVSISLGLPATFLFGGERRQDPVRRLRLAHGDVVVWGGSSRMRYHGVAPLKAGQHPRLGEERWNLTLRRAG